MSKQSKILLIAVIVLSAAYWFISKKPWTTAPKSADAFAVKDTNTVTKIFLANKNGFKILLERQPNNSWIVNGKELVDEPKIKLLLGTLHDIEIQYPVANSMLNAVLGGLSATGIKTEIYAGDQLIKTLYVGHETPEKTGTYMLIDGEEKPYSINVPGFVGYLTPRFILTEIKWKSKLVYNLGPDDIKRIDVNYPSDPNASFTYEQEAYQKQKVFTQNGKPFQVDTNFVKFYLAGFHNLYVEGYYTKDEMTPQEQDSIMHRTPYCILNVVAQNGATKQLTIYAKKLGKRSKTQFDENGKLLEEDPEKYFAIIDNKAPMASIQEYNFGRLFRKSTEFIKK